MNNSWKFHWNSTTFQKDIAKKPKYDIILARSLAKAWTFVLRKRSLISKLWWNTHTLKNVFQVWSFRYSNVKVFESQRTSCDKLIEWEARLQQLQKLTRAVLLDTVSWAPVFSYTIFCQKTFCIEFTLIKMKMISFQKLAPRQKIYGINKADSKLHTNIFEEFFFLGWIVYAD